MKKSFLITLAAVSSVALIGCSSSDDNGGNNNEQQGPSLTPGVIAPHATDSAFVNIPLVLNNTTGKTIKALECSYDEDGAGEAAAGDCTSLGFAEATDKQGFFVKADGITKFPEAAELTIKATSDADEKVELKINKALVDQTLPTLFADKVEVHDVEAGKVIKDLLATTTAKKIKIKVTDKPLVSYSEANKGDKVDLSAVKFHTVAIKDTNNFELVEDSLSTEEQKAKCSEAKDSKQATECFTAIKAKAAAGETAKKTTLTANVENKADTVLLNVTDKEEAAPTPPVEPGTKPEAKELTDTKSDSPAIVVSIINIPDTIKDAGTIQCDQLNSKDVKKKLEGTTLLVGAAATDVTAAGTKTINCTVDQTQVSLDFGNAQDAAKKNTAVVTVALASGGEFKGTLTKDSATAELKITKGKALNTYTANDLTKKTIDPSTITKAYSSSDGNANDATKLALGTGGDQNNQECNLSGENKDCTIKLTGKANVASGAAKVYFGGGTFNKDQALHTLSVTLTGFES